jgi:hypothetical protein
VFDSAVVSDGRGTRATEFTWGHGILLERLTVKRSHNMPLVRFTRFNSGPVTIQTNSITWIEQISRGTNIHFDKDNLLVVTENAELVVTKIQSAEEAIHGLHGSMPDAG